MGIIYSLSDMHDYARLAVEQATADLRSLASKWESLFNAQVQLTEAARHRADKAGAQREEARAEVERLTTLRPFPTDGKPVLYWGRYEGEWVLNPLYAPSTHWTPMPDVKEPK